MADAVDGRRGRRRAAVLGSPIGHSLSPALHRAAYAALGLDWTYEAIDVDEGGLADFLDRLDGTWAGLSLTMPLKEAVIPLLDDVDPLAEAVGAVNTVLPAGAGWVGANTDVHGIAAAIDAVRSGQENGTATILGAGATARSAVAALQRLGVRDLVVCARRLEVAESVAAFARARGFTAAATGLAPDAGLASRDVVVSTLPGEAGQEWALVAAQAPGILLDVAYHPWPTPLARVWPTGRVASGRDMLLWQAVEQVRLMTGLEPPVDRMRAALPD